MPTQQSQREQSINVQVMGGKFSITVVGGTQEQLESAVIFLHELEKKWSRFRSESEVTKLNNAQARAVAVSPETLHLINALIRAHKITRGYFDPTILPLLVKSGYANSRVNPELVTLLPENAKWPGDLLQTVISRDEVVLPIGTAIDPGGIGKGLAADLLTTLLMGKGVTGVLVNANGDVVVDGDSPQTGPWIIGIEDPFDSAKEVEQIRLTKGAVATSSRLHQTWESEGKKYHHIVNPLTGSIAVTKTLSATVVCATGADAEALAKVPFILEISQAIEFIEKAGAQVFIIDEDLKTHKSTGWSDFK